MTKTQPTRHRYTSLVHALYGAAVLAALVYGVLLLADFPARWVSLAFALCSFLPLVAFALDVWHTPAEEEQ